MSVVVAGEALVDLAPRDGLLLPLPGGSPYNVAVGLGRLGCQTHYLGGLSRDAFGALLSARLAADGVSLDLAPILDEPTTLAVVHLDDQGRASYGFYLDGTAAAGLHASMLPALPAGAALHVSLGAIGLGHVPTGHSLARLLETAHADRLTSLDPNVRPSVFAPVSGTAAYAALLETLVTEHLDLVKVSDEDLALLYPDAADPLDAARAWACSGPAVVVVTRGPDGAIAFRDGRPDVEVAGRAVQVVDTVGAGDAFTSGLLAWLDQQGHLDRAKLDALSDDDLSSALRQAVEVAAITCTRAGSDPPRAEELST